MPHNLGWPEPYIYGAYTVHIRYMWQGNHQMYGVYIQFWPTLPTMREALAHNK